MNSRNIFITGGTGYIGRRLIPKLLQAGHTVRALVRKGSESKAPAECEVIIGDPLDSASYANRVTPADTFIHLVGVPHPSPAKAKEFRAIDLASALESISAANRAGVGHFIYVSVAHPAPVMKAYTQARSEAEAAIRESGLKATVLRPWYVLGPGHRWPYLLIPFYRLFGLIPAIRETTGRLGLVTLDQMVGSLAAAVESPSTGFRIITVPEIRDANR